MECNKQGFLLLQEPIFYTLYDGLNLLHVIRAYLQTTCIWVFVKLVALNKLLIVDTRSITGQLWQKQNQDFKGI